MAGTCSWCVYISLASNAKTYLAPMKGTGGAGLLLGWDLMYVAYAIPLGLVAGVIGVVCMVHHLLRIMRG
jgi:hypothetical protein